MANTPAQVALDEKGLETAKIAYDDDAQHGLGIQSAIRAYLSTVSDKAGGDGQGALVERYADATKLYAVELATMPIEAIRQNYREFAAEYHAHLTRENATLRADKERQERERDVYKGAMEQLSGECTRLTAERRLAEQGQAQGEAVAYVSRCDLFSPSGLPIKAERRPTDTKNFPLYATPPSPEPDAEDALARHRKQGGEWPMEALKLLPVEPDDAMIEAGEEEIASRRSLGCAIYASDIYEAMVGAYEPSPDPRPAAQPGVVKALDLSNLLKHAFISGRESVSGASSFHAETWTEYDPEQCPAYHRISAALAAPVSQEPVADKWAIDNSTDSPILTYEKCSVIQDEQARYVMGLIRRDAGEPSEAEVRQAGDILMQHGLNAPEQVIYGAARALLASKSKGGQADG